MENIIPKDDDKNTTVASVDAAAVKNNQADEEEIVLYDECGDTLWDRVLRQEENKLKVVPASKS